MSLLNDALRDLEQRNQQAGHQSGPVPAGLRGGAAQSSRRPLGVYLACALLVLLAGLVGYGLSHTGNSQARAAAGSEGGNAAGGETPANSSPAALESRSTGSIPSAAPEKPAEPPAPQLSVQPAPLEKEPVDEAPVQPRSDELALAASPEPTQLPARAADKPAANTPASAMSPPAEADDATADTPAPVPGQEAEKVTPQSVRQQPGTPDARDRALAPELERLLVEGEEQQAAERLTRVRAEGLALPRSHGAMARYYLTRQQPREARRWLPTDLLAREPALRLLQGRALLMEQGARAALEYLEEARPPVAEAPDYSATLASLYQQTGNYASAGEHWAALLDIDSRRGDWWLGLGLALDSQNQLNGARMAYTEALKLPDLPPRLRAFAESRLDRPTTH